MRFCRKRRRRWRGGGSDETLEVIAPELVAAVRRKCYHRIDCPGERPRSNSHNRQADSSYGYPPDKQEKATQTVLEPGKVLCAEWVG